MWHEIVQLHSLICQPIIPNQMTSAFPTADRMIYFMVVIKMPMFAVTARNCPALYVKQVAGAQSCGLLLSLGRL